MQHHNIFLGHIGDIGLLLRPAVSFHADAVHAQIEHRGDYHLAFKTTIIDRYLHACYFDEGSHGVASTRQATEIVGEIIAEALQVMRLGINSLVHKVALVVEECHTNMARQQRHSIGMDGSHHIACLRVIVSICRCK